MANFNKKDILVVTVPHDKTPYHGWMNETHSGSLGIVNNEDRDNNVVFYTSLKHHATFRATEVKVVKHPWMASYSSLGAGVATAIFDAPDRSSAMTMAQAFATGGKDFTGRTLAQLKWSVPVAKGAVSLAPVFIGVDDQYAKMVNMAEIIYRRV